MWKETPETTWYWDSHRDTGALEGPQESLQDTLYFATGNLFYVVGFSIIFPLQKLSPGKIIMNIYFYR